jgi:vanillate O-demethylase ferredoxin subunit
MLLESKVWRHSTVAESTPIATSIRRIVIELPQPARFEPGAHVDIVVPVGDTVGVRSYSVVDASADGGRVALSVLRTATSRGGSQYMHSLTEGQSIRLRGPLQNFPIVPGAHQYLLLAGGIGITAIFGMAQVLRDSGAHYRLVYTGRTRAAMAYLAELTDAHGDRLEVHISEGAGRLDVDNLLAGVDTSTELYMCGPTSLMHHVRWRWSELSLPASHLRYETFGDFSTTDRFMVKVPRLGITTVVEPGQSVLDALEQCGIDVMSDCRKGECGLCEVRVLDVIGVIDHRDVFYELRRHRRDERMCSCVSRVTDHPSNHLARGQLPEVVIDVPSSPSARGNA